MPASPNAMDPGAGRFAHTRLYDLACAAPLIALYGFACAGTVILMARQWSHARDWNTQLTLANEAATLVFFALQIALCLFRRLPLAKSQGLWPRLTAMLGANFNFALLLLPRVALSGQWADIAAALTIGGTLGSVAVLAYLGRAFSIFPEARGLVVGGPYRHIRHPLYLMEIVSTLGIMLQFRQPWAALVVAATIAFQFRRMAFEETVLRATFADYEAYAARSARLIPGIY
ncbi:MAG TPA: isoprenylcysteine carboxylmethyltransferase family protein [Rhizomicrobium sp.]